MKFIFTVILVCASFVFSSPVLILSRKGVETTAVSKSIIGGNYVRSQTGSIWIIGWWSNPDMSMIPNSSTHTNIHVSQVGSLIPVFDTLKKSIAVSGITDYHAARLAMEFTPCDENGADLTDETEGE